MATLIAIPILGALLVLQSAVLSQIPLLHGTADLVLLALLAWSIQKRVRTAWIWGIIGGLLVGYTSALPIAVYLGCYLVAVGLALFLRQRISSVPLLTMLLVTFLSTLILQGITILTLRLMDIPIAIITSVNLIILPSLLLNILLAVPFFLVFRDLASFFYPEALEI
jgi:rod shape-determining protein MreD